MANTAKEINVVSSDDSIARILGKNRDTFSQATAAGAPNFSLRYSVPPESLNSGKSDSQLRKTVRGEYVVEESETSDKSKSTQNASKSGKPTFRGPGNNNKDTECVSVYNSKSEQYELHFMDMEIQVSPALKARARSGTPVDPSANQTAHGIFHNRKPTKSSALDDKSRPAETPVNPAPSSNTGSTSRSSVLPMHASTQPSSTTTASVSSRTNGKRTKKLPTRKKSVSKIKQAPNLDMEPPSEPDDRSVMATMKLPKDFGKSLHFNHAASQVTPKTAPPSAPSPDARRPTPIIDDKFDEDFNELADELAGDLMEDSDEDDTPAPKVNSMGTAGGSAEDGESSEEE